MNLLRLWHGIEQHGGVGDPVPAGLQPPRHPVLRVQQQPGVLSRALAQELLLQLRDHILVSNVSLGPEENNKIRN